MLIFLAIAVVTCPSLERPPNGDVELPNGVEYQSRAFYNCSTGYRLTAGDLTRTCGAEGAWSGSEPVCTGEYNMQLNKLAIYFNRVYIH